MGKNIVKNISKSLSSKYSQKRLDNAKKSAADPHLQQIRILQKESFKKQQKGIKLLIKLQGFQNIHNKVFLKYLQMSMIKKYLKKGKKDKRLLVNWD